IPVLAVVAQLTSWRWSLGGLGVLSAGFAVAVMRRLEPDPAHSTDGKRDRLVGLARTMPIYAAVGCMMTGAQSVVIVFGAWLEDIHRFSTAAIGGIAFLLGAGELVASTSTIRLTDRLGKRRAVVLGLGLMAPAAALLAAFNEQVVAGIALLVMFVIGFEFALVSILPLVGELHPEARATSIGIGFGFGTLGRGAGAAVSTWLYSSHGMGSSAIVGAGMAIASALFVLVGGKRAESHIAA
ncbi:MAG TPA: MFS transporter, partial [Acidimicrobiales bacterium]